MKIAISVPDSTFERVSKQAQESGMSRSEIFSRAAARYLDELESVSVTHQIDLALESLGDGDSSTTVAAAVGQRVLAATNDEW